MEAWEVWKKGCIWGVIALICTVPPLNVAYAQCEGWLAKPAAIEGEAQVMRNETHAWLTLDAEDVLCQGDRIRVLANSRVALEMPNDTVTRLDAHTIVEFVSSDASGHSWLDMIRGVAHFISRVPRHLTIKTPYMNAVVEGTEFQVSVTDDESSVMVFEGVVAVSNEFGREDATGGQVIAVGKNGAKPVLRTVVNPWSAIQWALYYPPLLTLTTVNLDVLPVSERDAWLRAVVETRAGNVHGALRSLDGLAPSSPSLIYRASLLLSVGRVDEAKWDIDFVLDQSPEDGNALALRSIIATVQNDREEAISAALDALRVAPELAAPRLALSYAWQSRFELERARDVLEQAIMDIPDNTLLWARMAEVRLMFREFGGALEAARAASSLEPGNAHAKTVLGFAQLLKMKTKVARQSFEQAIMLDPSAPLPRLGLGLALIRGGKLEEGRRKLEIAVVLDPANALLRSYLGKAYYEEKRNVFAADQFGLAKDLDPHDPTAWFYDAIRKQTENRLVEALHDLEQAIEKNDNRAVYRSKLLLDDDAASRNARMARVYQGLGFEELALLEGWRSLRSDPANHSAHQLLADAHSGQSRNEFASFSEHLQSQMLAPVGQSRNSPSLMLAPVGQSLTVSSLTQNELPASLNHGTTAVGFNEFSGLFVRDGVSSKISGLAGSDATYGEEIILSGLNDNMVFSLGQLHLETNGHRPNAEFKIDVLNAFAQYDLSPGVSIQFEARRKQQESGDIRQFVNDGNFSPELEDDRFESILRAGLRLSLNQSNHYLLLAGGGESEIRFDDSTDFIDELFLDVNFNVEVDGNSYEFQNIRVYEKINFVWGLGYDNRDTKEALKVVLSDGVVDNIFVLNTNNFSAHAAAAYVYSNMEISPAHHLTIGGSVDRQDIFSESASRFNPKLGWVWSPSDIMTLRTAAFRATTRPLFIGQTLEPTQVAGFTQIFDESSGIDFTVYAAAIDQRLGSKVTLGLEGVRRSLEAPILISNDEEIFEEDREILWYNAYLNYIFSERWVSTLRYGWRKTEKQPVLAGIYSLTDPLQLNTEVLNLALNYSNPIGLFSRLDFNFVSQKSRFNVEEGELSVNEKFPVVDFEIGFRFSKRLGAANFVVRNVFDNSFSTQQGPFLLNQPLAHRYYPEQAFFVRFDISFQ